jgi:murein DD-endopeptidase MepM/ murein hydrolase activator NlpD
MNIRDPVARTALTALLAALALAGAPGSVAAAQPPPPPNPSDEKLERGRGAVQTAAERVGVLTNKVAAAGADLTAAQVELAQTYDNVTSARRQQQAARAVADAAQAVADDARAAADAASAQVREAQRQVDEFAAASYRQGSTVGSVTAFLGSDSRQDLLDRAELLDAIGGSQLGALDAMRRARIEKANLDSAARAALQEARAREQAADHAKAAADAAYAAAVAAEAAAQQRNDELLARQADLERQLAQAQGALADLEGQRYRFDDWQVAQPAPQPSQSQQPPRRPPTAGTVPPGGAVFPTTGRITSTYGPRWGSIHYGLDIANRIGTPIVSAMDGVVISSGPASGFGLWVRVRHDDGTVTVYGHINETLVSVGERVVAGEQIATVGNRGKSTGPHLHFEAHQSGRKVDPSVWLRSNGVSI